MSESEKPKKDAHTVLLDTRQASARLHAPVQTLKFWRYKGIGPAYIRVGRRILYAENDIQAWLESRRQTTSDVA